MIGQPIGDVLSRDGVAHQHEDGQNEVGHQHVEDRKLGLPLHTESGRHAHVGDRRIGFACRSAVEAADDGIHRLLVLRTFGPQRAPRGVVEEGDGVSVEGRGVLDAAELVHLDVGRRVAHQHDLELVRVERVVVQVERLQESRPHRLRLPRVPVGQQLLIRPLAIIPAEAVSPVDPRVGAIRHDPLHANEEDEVDRLRFLVDPDDLHHLNRHGQHPALACRRLVRQLAAHWPKHHTVKSDDRRMLFGAIADPNRIEQRILDPLPKHLVELLAEYPAAAHRNHEWRTRCLEPYYAKVFVPIVTADRVVTQQHGKVAREAGRLPRSIEPHLVLISAVLLLRAQEGHKLHLRQALVDTRKHLREGVIRKVVPVPAQHRHFTLLQ
mmetsp:Transcript_40171/g.132930  ORF Transcript_40171/g.132930 Transcript_40171/m.132930 type:complete len:381 (-) Transcript_40171:243-1385(-)